MKYILSICFILFLISPGHSQTTIFQWAKKTNGGTGEEGGASIAVDASGNTYTTGSFNGTADFDPGAGVFNMTSAGSNDVFVLKLDVTGNFVWAKRMGGPLNDGSISLAINTAGDIYITGGFEGTVDFDPGLGTFNLTDFGSGDVFITKLDVGGNFSWAKQLGGADGDYVNALSIDNAGNVYCTGGFSSTADFDPGAGIFNLTCVSGSDVFISKLNAVGDFVWANQFASANATDYGFGYSITVDAVGNIYSTGSFGGTFDFDPGAGNASITSTSGDIYISKLDNNGNFLWANEFAATTSNYGYSYSIKANGSNVYLAGYFVGDMDFDPGAGSQVLSSVAGFEDIFVAKLDASGNFVWAKQMGGADSDYPYSLTTDAAGNVYTTGYFYTTSDFDPGPGVFNLSSAAGSADIFISKLDAAGNFAWAKRIGGSNFDKGVGIAVDASNNVYTTGSFRAIADFDPDAPVFNLTSSGSDDLFVHKMSQQSVLPVELISFTGKKANSINHLSWVTSQEVNNDYFTLEKSKDGIRFEQLTIIPGAGSSSSPIQYNYEDLNPYNGITYYKLKQTDRDGRSKYSRVIAISSHNTGGNQFVFVYPNPSSDRINFIINATKKTVLKFQIINTTGTIIKTGEQGVQTGENIIGCSISLLPAGMYVIKIFSDNQSGVSIGQFIKN
jgi:Secretion system C-terminal sorting domain/Beta-propeller repeat